MYGTRPLLILAMLVIKLGHDRRGKICTRFAGLCLLVWAHGNRYPAAAVARTALVALDNAVP